MKKMFLFFCTIPLLFCSCQKQEPQTPMAQIQQTLTEMTGYTCIATLTRTSNKGETVYETKQDFKSTGEYRLEFLAPKNVKGNYTVYDGKTICQYNPRLQDKIVKDVPLSQQRNELFLGQFLKNYMQSEGVSVETAALDESRCTVLEAVIAGNDPTMATEKLWIDNETLTPVRFVIYNTENKPTWQLDYTAFSFNPHFDEHLFSIPE